jgi:ssDNA-binding replication factor A large subunit
MVKDILDNAEGIIKKIQEKTKQSKEEIMKKIHAKQEEYGGLLTEAGAAYSIAKECGVKMNGEAKETPNEANSEDVKIRDLREGMTSVNATVTVNAVYPTKRFDTGSRSGEVTNIEINDDTGATRLVVWGKTDEITSISKNSKLRITNAYTKNNRDKIELHVSSKGSFEATSAAERLTRLEDVKDGMDNIDFYARVIRVFPVYEFDKDGRPGKVSSASVTDGTETRRVVFWNEHADAAKDIVTNEIIKVENAYARKNNELELHLGFRGRVLRNQSADIKEIAVERKKIKALTDDKGVEIKADVVEIYPPTIIRLCSKCKSMLRDDVCVKCGGTSSINSMIVNAELDDGTSVIRGTFYRDKAEQLLGIKADDFSQDSFDDKKQSVLGVEFVFFGEIKNVPEYGRKEFVVRSFGRPDYDKELEKINIR